MRGSMHADPGSVSVSSAWRRAMWLVLTPVGFLAVLRAAIYVLQADGTLQAASTDYAQAYLGIGGVLLGVLALCWLAFGVMSSISACAVTLDPRRVWVRNVRSVSLAWPMIDGVTTVAAGHRLVPALHLINGEVVPIRFAARLPARTQPGAIMASSAALRLIGAALAKREPGQSSWLAPSDGTLVRGRLMRSRQLPGPATADIPRGANPQLWWRALRRYMFSGLWLAIVELRSGLAGMVKLGVVGASYSAVLCLAVLAVDTIRIRRKLVVGADFVAWRPVTSRSWRILPFTAVVWADTVPGLASGFRNVPDEHNIQLLRSDGRGVTVRRPELHAGAAAALLASLGHSPAITRRAVETLTAQAAADRSKLALAD